MRRPWWGLVLAMLVLAWRAEAALPRVVQDHIATFHGAKAGVDARDSIWFWNPVLNTVTRTALDGQDVTSARLPDATSVDADTDRGIALLEPRGSAVQIVAWDGRRIHGFPIAEPAADIAWMPGSLVAVAPKFAAHRVEVWDSATGTLVRTIGPATSISRAPGRHLARATLLRYDRRRNEIVALDATFGRVYVYGVDGTPVDEALLPAAPVPLHEWLERSVPGDESSKAVSDQLLWRFPSVTVASDGAVWVGGQSDASGDVTVFKFERGGEPRRLKLKIPTCPGNRLEVWNGSIVLFRDPRSPQPQCAAVTAEEPVSAWKEESPTAPSWEVSGQVSHARPALRQLPDASSSPPPCDWPELIACGCPPPPLFQYLVFRCWRAEVCSDGVCVTWCYRECWYFWM